MSKWCRKIGWRGRRDTLQDTEVSTSGCRYSIIDCTNQAELSSSSLYTLQGDDSDSTHRIGAPLGAPVVEVLLREISVGMGRAFSTTSGAFTMRSQPASAADLILLTDSSRFKNQILEVKGG